MSRLKVVLKVGTDLADTLDAVHAIYQKYVSYRSEHEAVFLALWTAHTYVWQQAECTPYVRITSAEKASGKTRLIEVADLLVHEPRQGSVSPAALYRMISDGPTLLMDEADLTFTTKQLSETASLLLQVLNAGYRKGGCVYRVNIKKKEKDQLEEFEVFGPKVFAGIGSLPDTLASRSVEILLQRARPDEQVAKLRQREAKLEAEPIRTALAAWAEEVELPLEPQRMPEGLSDREEDYWEPLFVIAEEAGGGWPRLARDAAVALAKAKGSTDEGSLSMLLIEDLYQVWGTDEDKLTTKNILSRLNALEEAPWGNLYGRELNAHDLARYARRYGIASRDVRQGNLPVGKGYRRTEWYEHAWSRFLPQSVLVGTDDGEMVPDAVDNAPLARATRRIVVKMDLDTSG